MLWMRKRQTVPNASFSNLRPLPCALSGGAANTSASERTVIFMKNGRVSKVKRYRVESTARERDKFKRFILSENGLWLPGGMKWK